MQNRTSLAGANDNPLEVAATRKARTVALLRRLGFLGVSIGLTAVAGLLGTHVWKISVDFDTILNVRKFCVFLPRH
ncbi:hypothetical protein DWU98_19025 [Dyella monticola]|uniref:Uncharacterized protein n=1 Tax=Dyella monticola TaxID=1927958 RepID=A0A370WT01_9GAMM|nr:hypothetical protein DWU98_19025 [Dyella monticola]